MPFNSSGFFQRLFSWRKDRDAGIKILAERMDGEFDGIVAGLNEIVSGNVDWKGPMTGVFGTSAAPAFSFQGDPDTGVYRVSADTLGFSVGGNKKATINADGLSVRGNLEVTGKVSFTWKKVNDGAGSGLDADTLDGKEGAYYLDKKNLGLGNVDNVADKDKPFIRNDQNEIILKPPPNGQLQGHIDTYRDAAGQDFLRIFKTGGASGRKNGIVMGEDGVVDFHHNPYFYGKFGGATTGARAQFTKIISRDMTLTNNSYRITALKSGVYHVSFSFLGDGANNHTHGRVYSNYLDTGVDAAAVGSFATGANSGLISLAANDFFEVRCTNGGIHKDLTFNRITIVKVL